MAFYNAAKQIIRRNILIQVCIVFTNQDIWIPVTLKLFVVTISTCYVNKILHIIHLCNPEQETLLSRIKQQTIEIKVYLTNVTGIVFIGNESENSHYLLLH